MKKIFTMLIMVTLTGSLLAYSLLERETGSYIGSLDPRSIAMGYASVAGGNRLLDTIINPGNLPLMPDKLGAQFHGGLITNFDDRSLPMYNSFDAYCGDATYVSNVHPFEQLAGGVYYKHKLSNFDVAASFIFHPYIDFTSDYLEEVRNNANSDLNSYPPIIAKNYIEGEGSIDAFSVVTAVKYKEIATFGIRFSKLMGDANLKRRIIWSDYSFEKLDTLLTNTTNTLERDFEAFQVQIGTVINIDPRLSLGFSITPKVDFDVIGNKDGVDVEDVVYTYFTALDSLQNVIIMDSLTYAEYSAPLLLRAGLNYKPRNIMRTNFNLDVEFVQWSEINKLYDDAYNFYIGVEHCLKNKIPIRIGFNYQTSYCLNDHSGLVFADKVTMPAFTTGTGFSFLENFIFDIAVEYANRQYETLDLFMDSYYWGDDGAYKTLWENYYYIELNGGIQDRSWENPDTVKETFFKIQTSISYKW
ncbi:MAG: hypothetical protein ISS80_06715 [Candidatus Cloacimonetes bacterium]|nr:hypothetical protein [Candidatus Cloacimonadota bacterium]